MSALILPPRLNGNTRATLELRIEAILLTNFSAKQRIRKSSVKVFVRWWGQALSDGIYFSPRVVQSLGIRRDSSPASRGIRVAIYKVVTGKKRFCEYLADAERLFLELHSNDGDDNIEVVGYSIFERLHRLVDATVVSEDLDIFDETGSLIGKLRCQMFYEPIDSDLPDSSENSRNDEIRSVSERLNSHDSMSRSTSDPSIARQKQEAARTMQKPKVTFSDRNLEFPPSTETESMTRTRSEDSEQVSGDYTKKFQDFLVSNMPAKDDKTDLSRRSELAKGSKNFDHKSAGKSSIVKTRDFVPYQSVPSTKSDSQSRVPVRGNAYARPVLTSKTKPRTDCNTKPQQQSSNRLESYSETEVDDAPQTTLNETFDVGSDDENYNVDGTEVNRASGVARGNDNRVGKDFDDEEQNRLMRRPVNSRQVDEIEALNDGNSPSSELDHHSNEMKISEMSKPESRKVGFGRWKLHEHRLREVEKISQFVVRVRKIQFNQNFLASHLIAAGNSRFDRKPPLPVSNRSGQSEQQKISYFVTFAIPPRGEEITCCSVKRDKSRPGSSQARTVPVLTSRRRSEPSLSGKNQSKSVSSVSADIEFDTKTLHSVSFNETMLDIWFTQSLIFRIHSRSLNQRVPTYIGESSFALKHLLINDRHSSGQPQKIPIYISKQLVRELSDMHHQPVTYEIVGDIFVDFSFIFNHSIVKKPSPGPEILAKEPNIVGKKFCPKSSSKEKLVIASRVSNLKVPGKSSGAEYAKPIVPSGEPPKPVLLSLLLISEGRDFLVRDSSVRNLFVSCRFLGSGSLLTSEVCWNLSKPNFRFRHSIPIEMDDTFLENCCKNNFLILEVWSLFKPKDKLVGVATIPLHQIYIAYKNPRERELCLSLDLPVITVDGFVDVRDVLSGDVVGAIRCAFALGKEAQIVNFLRRFQGDRTGYISESWSRVPGPDSNPESEKHFDDNFAQTSILSTGTTSAKTTLDKSVMTVDQASSNENRSPLQTKLPRNPILKVSIEEARNLPRIKSRDAKHRLPPNAYVSLPNFRQPGAAHLPVSAVVAESCCPVWSFSSDVDIPKDFFADSNHHLIVKVWHCPFPVEVKPTSDKDKADVTNLNPDFERDPIIGFVAVDLSPLTLHQNGFDKICGWYNVMDFVGRCRGQVKLSVQPVNLREIHNRQAWTACLDLSSDEETCSLHRNPPPDVRPPEPEILPVAVKDQQDSGYKSKQSEPEKERECFWNPPETEVDYNVATKSFLAAKLSDLTNLADRLKAKLNQPAVTTSSGSSNLAVASSSFPQHVTSASTQYMTSSLPEYVAASVPKHVTSTLPQYVTSTLPQYVTSTLPQYVTSSLPQCVAVSEPQHGMVSLPQHVTSSHVTPSKAQNMTTSMPQTMTSSVPQPDVAGASVTLPNFVPRSFIPQPTMSSFGDFSSGPGLLDQNADRLVELSDNDKEEGLQRGDLLTFSVSPSGSESDAVDELANINWSVVSPESIREYEKQKKFDEETQQRRSRMAPDGGNPLEDVV